MNHELVEKMLNAFGTWPWERIGITRDQLRANMSAVLHVAAGVLLGPVKGGGGEGSVGNWGYDDDDHWSGPGHSST